MNINRKRSRRRWIAFLGAIGLVAVGGYLVANRTQLLGQTGAALGGQTTTGDSTVQPPTVTIQPADMAQEAVSAAGNLTLVSERSVALGVDGVVEQIVVAVGDRVKAGDILLKLDTTELERALAQAELSVESGRIALAELQTPASTSAIAQAEAALVEAKENLASVKAGPSAQEIAAARSSLAAAQSSYSELQAGPSDAERTQLSADLRKNEIAVAEAQRAYDQIAWRDSSGMSSEAGDLQSATIDYEAAKAAYAESTATASASDLESALSNIQSAQVQLNELLNSPTPAEVASAEAQVAEAEANLDDLQTGPTNNEVRSAQITLEQALIELEAAHRNLDAATVTAPIAGVVVALDAAIGERSGADTVVATLTDPTQLELVINVAEADMPRVAVNQQAQIEIDALPGKTFDGVVQKIAPINDSTSSSVSYPVTVRMTEADLAGVLPGMNAVATLVNQNTVAEGSWMVPTNGLRRNGTKSTVMVVRNGQIMPVAVSTGTVQGEWTLVQSPELQEGDQVVGSLTSSLNQQNRGFFPGSGGPPPGTGFSGSGRP